MLELHVLGPALGLPSIDTKCIAAIALLRCAVPEGKWALVASNDLGVSPFNELPALRVYDKNGQTWVAGYRNIASYIRCSTSRLEDQPIKLDLDSEESATTEAYLSFLESRGIPLLDLSLYVSSDNYTTATRPALSSLLAWPHSWNTPQRLRDEARKRSDHLGLSALDVDATKEKELKKQEDGISASIPKSLRISKTSVTSLLGSTAEQARFRLEAVTTDFFEPLEQQLGDRPWFTGHAMTSLDCFVLALLSQMLVKELPQPWLRNALTKYPRLVQWTTKHTSQLLGRNDSLPWVTVERWSWSQVPRNLIKVLAETMPVSVNAIPIRTIPQLKHQSKTSITEFDQRDLFFTQSQDRRDAVRGLITACFSTAGLVGALVHMGTLTITWPSRWKVEPVRQGFGEAGTFLGLA